MEALGASDAACMMCICNMIDLMDAGVEEISGCRCLKVCKSADASVSGGLSWAATLRVLEQGTNDRACCWNNEKYLGDTTIYIPITLSTCTAWHDYWHGQGMAMGIMTDGFTQGQASASKSLV